MKGQKRRKPDYRDTEIVILKNQLETEKRRSAEFLRVLKFYEAQFETARNILAVCPIPIAYGIDDPGVVGVTFKNIKAEEK